MKHLLQTVALMLLPLYAMAQSVGVGTTTPDASAKLDISATNAGLLIPRVSLASTTDAATIPSPATSLMVYNTNGALPEGAGYYYNSGTTVSPVWVRLQDSPASEGWLLTGNAGTDTATHFIGTTDAMDVSVRLNNVLTLKMRQNTALWTKSTNTMLGDSTGAALTSGNNNTLLGSKAAIKNNSTGNTVIGDHAMYENTTGSNNTVVGREAMQYDTLGAGNVAMGWRAMRNHRSGVDNVAVGTGALEFSGINNYNVAVGRAAMFNNERSHLNVAIGYFSLASMTYDPGSSYTGGNTAVGSYALRYSNPTASGEAIANTALGYSSMRDNLTGAYNTAVGIHSMLNGETGFGNASVGAYSSFEANGNYNSVMGYEAFRYDTTGSGNVVIGYRAMRYHRTGNDNVAVGTGAMENSNENYRNVAIGRSAMFDNERSNNNVAIGYLALSDLTYDPGTPYTGGNTAIGSYAMWHTNPTASAEGIYNSALGYLAMRDNLTGSYNVSAGIGSMLNAESALGNTVVGAYAGQYNNGYHNVAIGREAFRYDSTGTDNVAIGYRAMNQHHNGRENVAVGTGAMENSGNATFSVAVGRSALRYNTDTLNVGVGFYAGHNSTGYRNVYIGPYAGYSATGDQELFIDNSTTTNPLIYGDFLNDRVGLSTSSPGGYLEVYNNSTTVLPHLLLQEDNSDFARLGFSNTNNTRQWHIAGMIDATTYTSDALNFWNTSAGDIMTITGNGRVGIQTTAPNAVLDVRGDAVFNEDGGDFDFRVEGTNQQNLLRLDASNNNIGLGQFPVASDHITINASDKTYGIYLGFTNAVGTGTLYGTYSFVNATNSPTTLYGHRIYTSSNTSTSTVYGLYSGGANLDYAGYFAGNVYTTGTYLPSDQMLKSGLEEFDNALDGIQKLDVYSYYYNADEYTEMNLPKSKQYGLVAQNLQSVYPELVTTIKQPINEQDGRQENRSTLEFQGVNYTGLIPILTKAIQEQQELIEAQQKTLEAQQSLLKQIQQQLDALRENADR